MLPAVRFVAMNRTDPARAPTQLSGTAPSVMPREPSGVHRKHAQPDPEVFYVRRHRRGGFCVMIDGKSSALSNHYTVEDAVKLAEALAKKANARVEVDG